MKRKLQDMIQGKFEYDTTKLILQESVLTFFIIEGENFDGEFHFSSDSGQSVRGIIGCTSERIHLVSKEFEGIQFTIPFTFDSTNMAEGRTETGYFIITSNVGEYLLPFTAEITRNYVRSSIGKIKTLNDFTNLCKLNWNEALKLFSSDQFCNIFHENNSFLELLYRGLTARACDSHAMEEFLIGSGMKKRNTFLIDDSQKNYEISREAITDTVTIRKSDWGYLDIRVSCEENFIRLEKSHISMSDFIGKHYDLAYTIVPRLLHAGKNYACIHLDTPFCKSELPICIESLPKKDGFSEKALINRFRYELEDYFLDWKLQKTETEIWASESLELIRKNLPLMPDNNWNHLFSAFIYLKNGQKEEANQEVKSISKRLRSQRTPMAAFYLYLTTLGEDESYIGEVTTRVREIYKKYSIHPVVNWVLLQIDQSLLTNPERKYQFIQRYMLDYSCSPVFYLEAAKVILEHPELLDSQDYFSNRVLAWMSKKNLLTESLTLQIQQMAHSMRTYENNFYRILCRYYKKYPDIEMAKTICTYLIRLNQYGEKYFQWFRKAVEQGIKIAGLFEAFMLSWTTTCGEIPSEIIKYFSVHHSLPAKKKAALFAYIIRNKRSFGKDLDSYMVLARNFAFHELEHNHMNDELGLICDEIRHQLSLAEWKEKSFHAEDYYKVNLIGADMSNVRVLQEDKTLPRQRVAILGHQAIVTIINSSFVVLLEDAYGAIYCANGASRISKILPGKDIVHKHSVEQQNPDVTLEIKPDSQTFISQLENENVSMEDYSNLLREAGNQNINLMPYVEKLMIRMLFTGTLLPDHVLYFDMIKNDPDATTILMAYSSFICRNNMMMDTPLSESVFDYISSLFSSGHRMNAFCKAAFLRYYAENPSDELAPTAEAQLFQYLLDNVYFDFFLDLPEKLMKKYLLFDLQIITLRAPANQTLYIQFDSDKPELLQEVIPGIYSYKTQMFAGETKDYQIFDKNGLPYFNSKISKPEIESEILLSTKYAYISNLRTNELNKETQYEYARLEDVTEQLFQPIEE